MNNKIILEKLKEISKNLETTAYDEILEILENIDISGILCYKIPKNRYIFRGRPCERDDFTNESQISYRKKEEVKYFGRAHKPYFPMFYGAIAMKKNDEPIITNYTEILEIFKHKIPTTGENDLTIGRWRVINDLYVLLMIFKKDYLAKNKQFYNLYNGYINHIKSLNVNKDALAILEFISEEFAKPIISNDNEYKISAAFTEILFKRSKYEIDGIIYPSVRCEGENFNIALTPKAVDNRLKLECVLTTRIYYYNNKRITIDNLKIGDVDSISNKFELKTPINDPRFNIGKEKLFKIQEQLINSQIRDNILKKDKH